MMRHSFSRALRGGEGRGGGRGAYIIIIFASTLCAPLFWPPALSLSLTHTHVVWNTLFPAENMDPWSSGQSRNPRPVPMRTDAPYGCPWSSTWNAPPLHTMLAWSDSLMHESLGMLMSLQAPLPTVAPSSRRTAKLEAWLPSATVVNLRMISDREPGAAGAALTGGPAES